MSSDSAAGKDDWEYRASVLGALHMRYWGRARFNSLLTFLIPHISLWILDAESFFGNVGHLFWKLLSSGLGGRVYHLPNFPSRIRLGASVDSSCLIEILTYYHPRDVLCWRASLHIEYISTCLKWQFWLFCRILQRTTYLESPDVHEAKTNDICDGLKWRERRSY